MPYKYAEYKEDGTTLGPLLKRKGLTIKDIAKTTGYHESNLKKLNNGDRPLEIVPYYMLRKIADCLGIRTVDEMIFQAQEAVYTTRTEKMDKIIKLMCLHEANNGRITAHDMYDVVVEANRKGTYQSAGDIRKKTIFSEIFKKLKPDRILLSFGLTEIHAPDGTLLYEIQS